MDATKTLVQALERLKQIQEVELPLAMGTINMSSFSLLDGTPVKLHSRLLAGQLTDDEGLQWVSAHGGDSIIKAVITIEFDRSDIGLARALYEDLRARWGNLVKQLTMRQSVHPQTLVGYCNDLIRNQGDPPLDLLGVHRETRALVGAKQPKHVRLTGLQQNRGMIDE
jgi:hypothetical protein